jgi:hypothetical protein
MAVTLADAKLLTQDKLTQDVIDEFRKDDLLNLLVFDNCVALNGGSTLAYTYNRVLTNGTADFREINKEYTPQEAKTKQYTTNLKVFGGAFELDRVIQKHVKGVTNQLAFQMQQKIKGAQALFSDTFFNGSAASDAKVFDGIDVALTGSSTEVNPAAAIDLSSASALDSNYKAFLDAVEDMLSELDGAPTFLAMNRKLRSAFNKAGRRTVAFTETRDEFGKPVQYYNGIPLITIGDKPNTANPIIANGENGTSLYAVRVGLDGVCGITPEGDDIIDVYMPDFNTPGAVKKGEVEMVAGIAVKATKAAGVLRKIKVA